MDRAAPSMGQHGREPSPPTMLLACLPVLGVVAVVGGLAAGALRLLAAEAAVSRETAALLEAGALTACGLAAGCALWAAAWMVRRQHHIWMMQREILSDLYAQASAAAPASRPGEPPDADMWRKVMDELEEINAGLLMTPAQREEKLRKRRMRSARQAAAEVENAIEAADFARAEELLRKLLEAHPDYPGCGDLQNRLSVTRSAAETRHFDQQAQRVHDLMGVASFGEARKAAEELLARFPASPHAIALLETVRRESAAFSAEQRKRLYGELERHAHARQWRAALEAARKLLETYPSSGEADTVVARMQTLEENARIEEARESRDLIRDLIERKRFREALAMAQEVVARFPQAAIAEELRRQMPRLEELAATDQHGDAR